jgi:signal transduction histidine kinase
MSVRVRLLALFSLVVVAGLVGFLALWLFGVPALGIEGMFNQEIRRAITSTEVLADKERDTYERWFAEHRRALQSWSQSPDLSRLVLGVARTAVGTPRDLQATLMRRLSALKEMSPGSFRGLYVVAPDGKRVLASAANEIGDLPPEHVDAVWETLQPGMAESVRLSSTPMGASILALQQIPLVDALDQPTGGVAGVLVAELGLDTLLSGDGQSILQSLGGGGAVVLADASSEVLLDSSAIASNARNRYVARQLLAGSESSRVLRTSDGEELIVTFRHLHLGAADTLSLIAIRGTDEALHAIRTSFFRMGSLAVMLAVFTLGLFIYATNRVAQGQAQVLALNAGLEDRIRERTRELAASNESLTQTLSKLERTRTELVRSEKLAALGAMVAGVSHELNTPLGNSLMAASTMQDHTENIDKALVRGIKRSELENYAAQMREGNAILMGSLRRAAELVSSFKQVAVDQTSAQRRYFGLEQTVDEILMTLGPTIRKTSHQVAVQVPPEIHLDSYPGPLGQVLTNLVNNALLHAFESIPNGIVWITGELSDSQDVVLTLRDNGCGISQENLGRIFDPFFTTKLGHGGSGLGLNIVYNLMVEVLGGDITVQSVLGEGTCFTLTFPLTAPQGHPAVPRPG